MEPLTPYPYQERDIRELLLNDGTGIVATQVGGGKTLIAVDVAKRLGTECNFVIAPKGTHKSAWEKTIKRQIPDAEVRYVNSTKAVSLLGMTSKTTRRAGLLSRQSILGRCTGLASRQT